MLTKQEVFDKVSTHLFAQGKQALFGSDDDASCAYRGANGTQCAAGCLIPDDMYDESMEYNSIDYLVDAAASGVWKIPADIKAYQDLVLQLQHVHDTESNWFDTESMRRTLTADEFVDLGIDVNIINTLSFKDR